MILHGVLTFFCALSLIPLFYVVNNSLRDNAEMYHSAFGLPRALKGVVGCTWQKLSGQEDEITVLRESPTASGAGFVRESVGYEEAMSCHGQTLSKGYRLAWGILRPYMLNGLLVSLATAFGVLLVASLSAYVFARYRFPGRNVLFMVVLSLMMIPAVLTLVPSFLLVKKLGLLNSYWVLILPYMAGGQVIAIFILKGFFEGLPEALFESARLDGAGHLRIYWHIVLPLSKQVIAVVLIMNMLATWNEFLWPFIVNSDADYHVVASGLYLMGQTQVGANYSTMYAGHVISSIPLLLLFVYGTKHFISGVTAGAFKA